MMAIFSGGAPNPASGASTCGCGAIRLPLDHPYPASQYEAEAITGDEINVGSSRASFKQALCFCLKLIELSVPSVVIKGSPVSLNCSYDLERDKLYSIKWHKNNVEFYRHLPEDKPPGQKYELAGIFLDLSRSKEGFIYMYQTNVDSEGIYRCEVSAEAPSFQTVKGEKEMRIYVFPTEKPKIMGTRPHYRVGDEVNINCVTEPSRPAAILKWWINGNEVTVRSDKVLVRPDPIESSDGLFTSTLALKFIAKPTDFLNGTMRLQCEAMISQSHTLSSEEILITNSTERPRIVSDSPNDGPNITSGSVKYQVGDIVDINCTSSKSQPPAELHWYINDKEAKHDYLIHHRPLRYSDGQESTVLGLRFEVKQRHFQKNEMRLRCTATLSEVIRMSSEEFEVDNKQQISGFHVNEQSGAVSSNGRSRRKRNSLPMWSILVMMLTAANPFFL